jgi:hypothetical protein
MDALKRKAMGDRDDQNDCVGQDKHKKANEHANHEHNDHDHDAVHPLLPPQQQPKTLLL